MARLPLLSLALGLTGPARAQVPDALLGAWESADSLEQVVEVEADGSVPPVLLYTATTFTDTEVVWTSISRWEGMLFGWREVTGVRAKGDRLVMADTLDTRYRLVGDTLTIDYEQPDGQTVLQRADPPTVPPGLLGTWSAGFVDDGAGIMVEIGLRFFPDGRVETVPGSPRPQRYALAGPFLLMWEKLSPERRAQGEIPHHDVYRMGLDGDRLTLTRPSETLRLERYPE